MTLDEVRALVVQHGRLMVGAEAIAPETDLYEVGLTSLATVHLMLALEEHFGVEFPDRMLGRRTFESVRAITEAIDELRA
jgi:acyl carrier protein